MGEVATQLSRIIEDAKKSWYFRVWALFWLAILIVFLVGFGEFVNYAKNTVWYTSPQSTNVYFPTIEFRPGDDSIEFLPKSQPLCGNNDTTVAPAACKDNSNTSQCIRFDTTKFSSQRSSNFWSRWILCTIYTTSNANSTLQQRLLSVWTEGGSFSVYQTESWDTPVLVAPHEAAFVTLVQSQYSQGGNSLSSFDKLLTYQSANFFDNGTYKIYFGFDSMNVQQNEQTVFYTGWMSAADIGGLGFFLGLVLTGVMLLVGVLLLNDSKFLNPLVELKAAAQL